MALKPEPDRFPIMSTKYYSIMGMYKELGDLEKAINAEITKAWAACENVASMSRYGLGDPDWFAPPVARLPCRRRPAGGLEVPDLARELLQAVLTG